MPFCAMHHYPVTAAKQIFEGLEPLQLFELSRLSVKMEEKIKEAAVKCEKHYVSFTRSPSILLDFNGEDKLEFVFNMPFPKEGKLIYDTIKGLKIIYAAASQKKVVVYSKDKNVYKTLYGFYDHVAGLFQTPMIGQLDVDVDKIKNLIGLLAIPELNHCQTLQLIGEEMEEEDAKYIQDNCQIHETLSLNGKVGRRDQHYKLYEVKNLIIRKNDWINISDIHQMQGQYIHIEDSKISDTDLIEFVLKWKRGETNNQLKYLYVEFTGKRVFVGHNPPPNNGLPPMFPIELLALAQHVPLVQDDSSSDSDSDVEEDEEARRVREREEQQGREEERVRALNDAIIHGNEQNLIWRVIGRSIMDFKKHPKNYVRGDETYSKLILKPDTIELDKYYRDIRKNDGTIASIRIYNRVFTMIVWPNIKKRKRQSS